MSRWNENIKNYKETNMRRNNWNRIDDEQLIREVFAESEQDEMISQEINEIKREIRKNNLNGIVSEWVTEWNERKISNTGRDKKTEEIRDFVTGSLNNDIKEPEISFAGKSNKSPGRSVILYISLAAAAIAGAFIIVRTLLPSYNPDKLFDKYYEPLSVVSPVTRNINPSESDSYKTAIELYQLGDYQGAATGFSDAMQGDNSAVALRFFMGITQLALGNYDQSVSLLSDVTGSPGEFGKEAEWYLGLAYLKSREKEKALSCFRHLAQTQGFYQERAETIVRRMK
jgi:TolA-binding protein